MTASPTVLHVHAGNLYGGVETMMLAYASEGGEDVRHVFALCYGGRLEDELGKMRATSRRLASARISRPLTAMRARRDLRAVIEELQPEVVSCHSAWSHALFAGPVKALDLPLVFWLHGPSHSTHWLNRLARRWRPDLVICNSRHTAGSVGALFPGVTSEVVYPAVRRGERGEEGEVGRQRVRTELGTRPDSVVVVQVSRMEEWKGHHFALRALAAVPSGIDWKYWVVGGAQRDGEWKYLEELENAAAELGIAQRVRFLGERRDVRDLLAAADIFIQPNTEPEPFGIVFIEALQAGLPIVASASGGALEIVDEGCGRLVAPGDVAQITEALAGLMGDSELRRDLGERGPGRARELTDPEQQNRRLAEVLSKVTTR